MQPSHQTMRIHRGFSLIEVLVICAIVVGMISVFIPMLINSRERGRQTSCLNNQKQLATMIVTYTQDHDSMLPKSDSVWLTLRAIRLPKDVFVCLTVRQANLTSLENDYVYNDALSGQEMGQIHLPAATMVTADGRSVGNDNICRTQLDLAERHFRKLNASFLDGHVEFRQADGLLIYH